MANVASSESVRLTTAQRDALIEMAARLQAEHEATVGADELVRAATEAGVDPRFLSEAARRLEVPGATEPLVLQTSLLALGGLLAFNGLFLGITLRHWFFPLPGPLQIPLIAAAAAAFAIVHARHRTLRWAAVAAPIPLWLSIGVAGGAVHFLHGGGSWWYHFPHLLLAYGLVQVLAAATVALAAKLGDRNRP